MLSVAQLLMNWLSVPKVFFFLDKARFLGFLKLPEGADIERASCEAFIF